MVPAPEMDVTLEFPVSVQVLVESMARVTNLAVLALFRLWRTRTGPCRGTRLKASTVIYDISPRCDLQMGRRAGWSRHSRLVCGSLPWGSLPVLWHAAVI